MDIDIEVRVVDGGDNWASTVPEVPSAPLEIQGFAEAPDIERAKTAEITGTDPESVFIANLFDSGDGDGD